MVHWLGVDFILPRSHFQTFNKYMKIWLRFLILPLNFFTWTKPFFSSLVKTAIAKFKGKGANRACDEINKKLYFNFDKMGMLILYIYILRVGSWSCIVFKDESIPVSKDESVLVSKDESVLVLKVECIFFTVRSGSGPRFGFICSVGSGSSPPGSTTPFNLIYLETK